jgi:hypothetical protein
VLDPRLVLEGRQVVLERADRVLEFTYADVEVGNCAFGGVADRSLRADQPPRTSRTRVAPIALLSVGAREPVLRVGCDPHDETD